MTNENSAAGPDRSGHRARQRDEAAKHSTSLRDSWNQRRPASLTTSYTEEIRLIKTPFTWFWVIAGLLVALCAPLVLGRFYLHVINLSLIAVVGAIALNLLTGNAGLISLGQAALIGLGAFAAATVANLWDVPFALAMLAAVAVGAIVGLIVGLPSLRLKALYIAVTTFALHYAALLGMTSLQSALSSYVGLPMPTPSAFGYELDGTYRWYYVLLIIGIASIVVGANLRRSRVGRAWTATHDRETAAEALGVPLTRAKLSAFVFSSAMVAFAGALAGYYSGTVTAETYGLHLAIAYLAMIIMGGMGRVLGSVLGAFFVIWLPYVVDGALRTLGLQVSSGRISGLQVSIFAILLILFLLVEPGGLAEIWRRIRDFVVLWPYRSLPLEQRDR